MEKSVRDKVVFVSRTMPHYRLPVLEQVDDNLDAHLVLICSKDGIPGEKAKKFSGNSTIRTILLAYRGGRFNVFGRKYPYGWFKGLMAVLKDEAPTVVVLEGESNIINNIIVFFFCKKYKIPYLWWSCGRVRDQPESIARKILKPLLGLLLTNAAAVLGYSSYACRYFQETYGVLPEKTFVACNSLLRAQVDDKIKVLANGRQEIRLKLNIDIDAPVILYVGAVVKEKNPDLFLTLFKEIKADIPGLHAILVGGGSFFTEIEDLSQSYSDFHIIGPVQEGVEAYFLAADVFVMPGLGGLALQQAMMCSMPVVCSIADGTELDLVQDGVNGFFLEPGASQQDWAGKITQILLDSRRKLTMGQESRRIIDSTFNSDIMVERIIAAIHFSLQSR